MATNYNPQIITNGLSLYLDAGNIKNYNLTEVEVLVVAGGGGGGMDMGGGGGGGGVIYNRNFAVTPGSAVAVTVGNGGAGAPAGGTNGQPSGHQFTIGASNGGNSVFGSLTAIGGGAGGSSYWGYLPNNGYGATGGSGGGASGYSDGNTGRGGSGTSGQGFAGGGGGGQYYAGGGGGAGGAGVSGPSKPDGGPGVIYPSMSPYYFGGGGGGGSYSLSTGGDGGIGGGGGGALGTTYGGAGLNNGSPGGGGGPNQWANTPGGNAGANTGGGGGGGSHYNANNKGGDGGSGIVIVRYPGPQKAIGGTVTSVAGHTIHTFTTTGSTTFTPLIATNNSAILGLSDFSGNGNFGTTANSPTYSSANGGSVSFDGTDDYVNSNLTLGTDATIEFVAKANWNQNNSGGPIPISINSDNYSSGPQPFFYSTVVYGGGANNRINWNTGNAGSNPFSNSYIPDTNWHIFCISNNFSSGVATLYIDGILIGTATALNMTTTGSNKLWIGRWHDGGYSVNMNLSSVKIYNRALTAAEIQQNFTATRARFGI